MKSEFIIERQGSTFVLYAGLLDQAHQEGLKSIRTVLLQAPSDANGNTAIVQAEVETSKGVFTGIGDASPGNVTRMIVPHLIRMAETRSKARALRDAINVGICAWEETGPEEENGAGRRTRRAAPGQPVRSVGEPYGAEPLHQASRPAATRVEAPMTEGGADEPAPASMLAAIEKLILELGRLEGHVVTQAEAHAAAEGRFLALHGHPLASGTKAEVARLYNALASEKKARERLPLSLSDRRAS